MQSTILTSYSNLLLTIYREAQEVSVQEFQDAVLDTLKDELPFDTSMWGTATMTDQGIDIHSLHLHNTTQAMIDAYQKVKHLDVAAMRVTAKPKETIGFATDRDFEGEELRPYREFLREFRHENFFITSDINPLTRFAQWVSLYRHDTRKACTPLETELLSCLAPHLMQALAINRLVHMDRLTGDAAREKWCVAIADSRGVLYHADPRFRELLQIEWGMPDPMNLPPVLLQQLLNDEDNQVTGRRTVVRRNLERGLLYLRARDRAPVDNLSSREFLVARLLASGLTQKQVAAQLERSPETIRSQVKTIFDKLAINNITMLGPLLAQRE
jgi:DNA-binding CsgD family transcriptional regulator